MAYRKSSTIFANHQQCRNPLKIWIQEYKQNLKVNENQIQMLLLVLVWRANVFLFCLFVPMSVLRRRRLSGTFAFCCNAHPPNPIPIGIAYPINTLDFFPPPLSLCLSLSLSLSKQQTHTWLKVLLVITVNWRNLVLVSIGENSVKWETNQK